MNKIRILPLCVSELVKNKTVFNYPTEKIWNPNGISLAKRIKDNDSLETLVDKALKPNNINTYIVAVDNKAPTRCIDGRITKGWNPDFRDFRLGPKIAGGTVHAALAHRIVDSNSIREDLLLEHDIEYIVGKYKEIGIGFGGHVDSHSHGWNTGCGAVDNINLILDKLQRPESQEQLRGLAHIILGDAYDGAHITNEIIGRMLFLDALKPTYMPKKDNNPKGEFLYKKTVVSLLRKTAGNANAVPQLDGPHNEVALVLNFKQGTTFHSDKFSYDNHGEIQAFGWDIWEMHEEAKRLYPYNMHESIAIQRESIDKRMKHITTRTLLGLSTAMVLTDGSLKVITVE